MSKNNRAVVYPREIIKRGLALAAKIILAHNHPSGEPNPSAADKTLTVAVAKTLAALDIDLLDHIIIGDPDCFSFADAGLL